ncbi:MAG: hypothetical protein Q4P33_07580 [Flaviflexus sp.]|nr:hypothetical protein [Flaviflexus sp.]
MKISKMNAMILAGALALSLSGCGSKDEPEAPEATETTAAAETTEAEETEASAEEATTEEAPATEAEETTAEEPEPAESEAGSPAELADPELTELTADMKIPEQVGSYTGEAMVVSGLGDDAVQVEFNDADSGRYMTLVFASSEVEYMIELLQGTDEPLGKIGACGYMNGLESTPTCKLRTEGNHTLSVGGDYEASLDDVRDFTIHLINAMTE